MADIQGYLMLAAALGEGCRLGQPVLLAYYDFLREYAEALLEGLMMHSIRIFIGLVIAMTSLIGCRAVEEQTAYRERQRQECTLAGGYFEENKPGAPDNYTCKGLSSGQTTAVAPLPPAPPTNCRTATTTIKRDDGTEETKTNQVCSSL